MPLPLLLLRLLSPTPPRRLLLCLLTCSLLRCLGYLLSPPLFLPLLCLCLLLLRLRLLVVYFCLLLLPLLSCLLRQPLLVLSPLTLLLFLSRVRRLYMGWVWVALPLLGFPLSPFIHLLLPCLVLQRPLLGCLLPPIHMIRLLLPLLRPLLILSMRLMIVTRMKAFHRLTLRLLRSHWTPRGPNIAVWWSMCAVCSHRRRVCLRLRRLLARYLNPSSLLLRPLPIHWRSTGSTGCAPPLWKRMRVLRICWLRGVQNA